METFEPVMGGMVSAVAGHVDVPKALMLNKEDARKWDEEE